MNYLDGQLVLVPKVLSEILRSNFASMSTLLDLGESIEMFSSGTTASFILANELYDPKKSKNLFDSLYATLSKFDFMGSVFTTLSGKNQSLALNLRKDIDGKRTTMNSGDITKFVEGGVSDVDNYVNNDNTDTVQFYVPEVFVIENKIYGVCLKSVSASNVDENSRLYIERDAVAAMLEQLGKCFNNNLLMKTELFKEYIRLSQKLGTI